MKGPTGRPLMASSITISSLVQLNSEHQKARTDTADSGGLFDARLKSTAYATSARIRNWPDKLIPPASIKFSATNFFPSQTVFL